MDFLFSQINALSEYKGFQKALLKGASVGTSGLSAVHKSMVAVAFLKQTDSRALFITPTETDALKAAEDLAALGLKTVTFPSRDYQLHNSASISHEYEQSRINALSKIAEGDFSVAVMSAEAAVSRVIPSKMLKSRSFLLKTGDTLDTAAFREKLVSAGYVFSELVEGRGMFSVRGDIIDVFPSGSESPVRIELWGDEIDSINYFDAETQRRTESLDFVRITPSVENMPESNAALSEALLKYYKTHKLSDAQKENILKDADALSADLRVPYDRYLGLVFGDFETVFDYFDGTVFVSDTNGVLSRLKDLSALAAEEAKLCFEEGVMFKGSDKFYLKQSELSNILKKRPVAYLENFPKSSFISEVSGSYAFGFKQLSPYSSVSQVAENIAVLRGSTVVLLGGEDKAVNGICRELNQSGIEAEIISGDREKLESGVYVAAGNLSSGIEIPSEKFLLYTFARAVQKKRKRLYKKGQDIGSIEDLKIGDYVVHASHGIGVFSGIQSLTRNNITRDYIKIKYAGSDVLYVPVTSLDLVSRYIGAGEETVKLNRLGSAEWEKTKQRVRKSVKDIAKELTALYAKRMSEKGFSFTPDGSLQSDFENSFMYEETDDQLRCADEIKRDMESPVPMDRLLCGDVGFGKTEVAFRAAFKCIADGKQCAVLVPTTILAHQHFETAVERFSPLPVTIEMLSRFRTAKQQTEIRKNLKNGKIDLIIGTHKLIGKDVEFHDLGLLIVDEEQRFGVAQKEKLKELFPSVDVLTLSATPIPRTLNMALSGLRDISSIEEAPLDRQPVQTYVLEQNDGVVAEAIERELRRGGQVFYVHNNIDSIFSVATRLSLRFPDARIAVAHGRMGEEELSRVWENMIEEEVDILVCTTIIETGVDIPNANTLIVENADRMGLTQLHQLRGRVGRSRRRASAYFFYKQGKALNEISKKRLDAIREYTEFGSGFKIAMRDLEIRGAGNILGGEQHGHMESVGYDMYLKLLNDAMNEEKGESTESAPQTDCVVEFDCNAHIPEKCIPSLPQRLSVYRKIAAVRSDDGVSDIIDELIDRFGEPPKSVTMLIDIALIRARGSECGATKITESGGKISVFLGDADPDRLLSIIRKSGGNITFSKSGGDHIVLKPRSGQTSFDAVKEFFDRLHG